MTEFTNYVPPSWDEHFMKRVYDVAAKSKDGSSKLGAVLVEDNAAFSDGYNGFPRGINDDVECRHERPEKYHWFEHAERNSIYNAARRGISTLGATMYTNGIPCTDCARAIVQAGIKRVITHKEWNIIQRVEMASYAEHFERTEEMLFEAGVRLIEYSPGKDKLLDKVGYLSGEKRYL